MFVAVCDCFAQWLQIQEGYAIIYTYYFQLVTAFAAAQLGCLRIEDVSLLFTMIQTMVAIMDYLDFEGGIAMMTSMLVVSGTHGVVCILVEGEAVTSAEQVQVLPAPPYGPPFGVAFVFYAKMSPAS